MHETFSPIQVYNSVPLMNLIASGAYPELVSLVVDEFEAKTKITGVRRLELTIAEFSTPGAKVFFYFDSETNQVVGELTANVWRDASQSVGGRLFSSFLRQQGICLPQSTLAFHVGGIVVNSAFRGQQIGTKLMVRAVEELNPAFIFGETKSPSAIFTRLKALANRYILVWGGQVISPHELSEYEANQVAQLMTEAFFVSRQIPRETIHHGTIHVSEPLVSTDPIDVDSVPNFLRDTFVKINNLQSSYGDQRVVWSPLVAVRHDLVDQLKASKYRPASILGLSTANSRY